MRLFAYYWPDETISLVVAETRDDAAFYLDEIGAAGNNERLVPVKSGYLLTLKPVFEEPEFEDDQVDEKGRVGPFTVALCTKEVGDEIMDCLRYEKGKKFFNMPMPTPPFTVVKDIEREDK